MYNEVGTVTSGTCSFVSFTSRISARKWGSEVAVQYLPGSMVGQGVQEKAAFLNWALLPVGDRRGR